MKTHCQQETVVVNLQDAEADQQYEDALSQETVVVNLQDSEADQLNDLKQRDNDAAPNLKGSDDERKVNQENKDELSEVKKRAPKKTVGIAFPSTDLKNVGAV